MNLIRSQCGFKKKNRESTENVAAMQQDFTSSLAASTLALLRHLSQMSRRGFFESPSLDNGFELVIAAMLLARVARDLRPVVEHLHARFMAWRRNR